MKTIVIESLLVVASALLWLIVLPIAALLSPVLPVLARAAQRSPILPPEDKGPPRGPFLRPARPRRPAPVRLIPDWRIVARKAF